MVLLMSLLLNILLKQKEKYFMFRSDLFVILSLIIILRLSCPFEFPFTISLYLSTLMNPINSFLNFEIYSSFTVIQFLIIIWILGSVTCFIFYIKKLCVSKQLFNQLKCTSSIMHISDFMKVDNKYNYEVWKTKLICTPMVISSKKVILLPENNLEERETYFVLLHEMQHIKYYDIYIKHFLNLLLVIYWWFFPVYWIVQNINLVLEIRADDKATKNFSEKERLLYASTLINIEKKLFINDMDKSAISSSCCFIQENQDILSYRIRYLIKSHFNRRTNLLLTFLIALFPLFTNIVIFEADYGNPTENEEIISEEDLIQGYILCHKDGSYSYVLNDLKAKINNPNSPEFLNLPRIKEGETIK